ncbi:MAG: hypothetical protein IID44_16260 [Planctomycetes bacterium]|nr:hypothetical protein [Planctomycetota bacterium]
MPLTASGLTPAARLGNRFVEDVQRRVHLLGGNRSAAESGGGLVMGTRRL